MATLEYNEVKERKYIVFKDEPYEIMESHVARTQQRKPQNQVKMKNLINGKVIPGTFYATDKVEEAEVLKREAKFIYANKGEYWFCNVDNPKERYTIEDNILSDNVKFLKADTIVDLLIFEYNDEETIIGLKLPIKMTFTVKDAPPAIRGNTSGGGNKLVTLETGAQITTPLFIEAGEQLIVNTETGEYVERANKK